MDISTLPEENLSESGGLRAIGIVYDLIEDRGTVAIVTWVALRTNWKKISVIKLSLMERADSKRYLPRVRLYIIFKEFLPITHIENKGFK